MPCIKYKSLIHIVYVVVYSIGVSSLKMFSVGRHRYYEQKLSVSWLPNAAVFVRIDTGLMQFEYFSLHFVIVLKFFSFHR